MPIPAPSNPVFTRSNDSVFENLYVWNNAYIENLVGDLNLSSDFSVEGNATFSKDVFIEGNLSVSGTSSFVGNATFDNDVEIKDTLDVNFLLVRTRLDVGVGGTALNIDTRTRNIGIFTSSSTDPTRFSFGSDEKAFNVDTGTERVGIFTATPVQKFQVGVGTTSLVFTQDGILGIGTTTPSDFTNDSSLKIDIDGSASIAKDLLVKRSVDVGVGGTLFTADTTTDKVGIGTSLPVETIQLLSGDNSVVVTGLGTVGIGTTVPAYFSNDGSIKLDLEGSIAISKEIYDSRNLKGGIGNFLSKDANGITWVSFEPSFTEGIFLMDEGVFVPTPGQGGSVGAGQSFTILNFVQRNSLGLGTDTLVPTARDPQTNTGLATIFTNDLWGFVGIGSTASIYRMTKVGINTDSPGFQLDVNGTLGATGIVSFTNITESTGISSGALVVSGGVGIGSQLNVAGITSILNTAESTGISSGALVVKGGVGIGSDLNIAGITSILNTTTSTSKDTGALIVEGGVGIEENLNMGGDLDVDGNTELDGLNVDGDTTLDATTTDGLLDINAGGQANTFKVEDLTDNRVVIVGIGGELEDDANLTFNGSTLNVGVALNVDGATTLNSTLDVDGNTTLNLGLDVDGATTLNSTLDVDGNTTLNLGLDVDGATTLNNTLDVDGATTLNLNQSSTSTTSGTLVVTGGVGIGSELNVGSAATFKSTVEFDGPIIDVNNTIADPGAGKTDYRLASVGTGVSWRPSGVQTKKTIWVSKNGSDLNSGLLEGDAKASVGSAAAVAQEGDTIKIRPGKYLENNPIGLRTDVTITGEDLRLVTIVPENKNDDVIHVRRGCLIENLSFAGGLVGTGVEVGCDRSGAVAFPPTQTDINAGISTSARSGFLDVGPATEGSSGRWRSPYVRNCTNFMTGSIGMKINGDHAVSSDPNSGSDLKSMVCDSFTQYNEAGIGVSLTNNAYAQLVSIFTINCDIAIFASSGAQCDLTNSNSSFGNFGLVATGLGKTEATGIASNRNPAGELIASNDAEIDRIILSDVRALSDNQVIRPFDGQALYFKIDLDNYPDAVGTGRITEPLRQVKEVKIIEGSDLSGFSALNPPTITILDGDTTGNPGGGPLGPQGIVAEASATVDVTGEITEFNLIASGRNYLGSQNLIVDVEGNTGIATVVTEPIYFTVFEATEPTGFAVTGGTGITTVSFNEFIPYEVFPDDPITLQRISRILTSSHSFEYVGTGTDINRSTPLVGGVTIKANEIVARDGAQIPFTSTDQKGNFDIGEGIQIDQTTSTVRGRDFNRAVQANVTPLILALR